MMDILICIVFVRGKLADDTIVDLATQRNIAILQTALQYVYCLRYAVPTWSQRRG